MAVKEQNMMMPSKITSKPAPLPNAAASAASTTANLSNKKVVLSSIPASDDSTLPSLINRMRMHPKLKLKTRFVELFNDF